MEIKGLDLDPVRNNTGTQKTVPRNLAEDSRFKNILMMWQDDGVVAQDATAPSVGLTEEQKSALRNQFDIGNMASLQSKRALLNELVKMGEISAGESELATMQMLPPAGPGGTMLSGMPAAFEDMMDDPNYLSHLERAIEYDNLWSRSDDVRQARVKLYDTLKSVFTDT